MKYARGSGFTFLIGEGPQMRRVLSRGVVGATLAAITLLAVSACSSVPGITSQWSAMTEPRGWEPKAGACFTEFFVQAHRATYKPIECTTEHRYETIAIGQFSGNAASLTSPPGAGSPELKAAWADCDAKTTEFLGGEWRNGKIWVGVSTPSSGNWTGGARWYRCEIGARASLYEGTTSRSKTLKGEFAGESALKYGCFQQEEKEEAVEKACTEPHNAEYTGFVKVSYTYDELKDHHEEFFRKCWSNIAQYAGVPDDGNVKYRTGVYIGPPTRADWEAGDTTIRCYMWLGKEKKTRSIKGAGNGGLPIHYA